MKKKIKYKINWKKIERNIIILLNIATISLLIYTIATKGMAFFSTIGYFN